MVPDIVVVSDLHIGRGKNSSTGRYYELETFFYDADFRAFCEFLVRDAEERETPLRMILNGDAFDLLRLDRVPLHEQAATRDQTFAPVLTPARAATELESILEGHPLFVEGIALVLAAGHEVLFLPGNHDIEVQWQPVQDVIAEALRKSGLLGDDPDEALERLVFKPWFHYEPGRLWIEHGCQYDPENAFRYPLRRGLTSLPDAIHEAELDNPLGNFFQRYLYNAFGHITFIVPSTRANARYLKWMLVNQPQLLLTIVKSHWWFWWQILRRVAKYPSRDRSRIQQNHERELNELAEASELGDKLREIDELKEIHADIYQAIRGFGYQALKFILAFLLVGSLVLGLWFTAFHGINQMQLGLMGRAFLFLTFGFFFLLSAFGTVLYTLFRGNVAVPPQPLRHAAAKIARIVDVPIVSFGHSHDEVLWRNERTSGEPSWYFNTGTWIAVFTHDVLLPRERVQFTFLRVRGQDAELQHWSPGRGEPLPVILIDEVRDGGARRPGEAPS